MSTTATASEPHPPVRVYAKRPRDRRWKLLGAFATRSAAWEAISTVPRGFEVWVSDQPRTRCPAGPGTAGAGSTIAGPTGEHAGAGDRPADANQ